MSKDSSAKYYQEKKERFRKKACERYQDFPKGKKSDNAVANYIKISQKKKSKG